LTELPLRNNKHVSLFFRLIIQLCGYVRSQRRVQKNLKGLLPLGFGLNILTWIYWYVYVSEDAKKQRDAVVLMLMKWKIKVISSYQWGGIKKIISIDY
jgi:hypothetical protein